MKRLSRLVRVLAVCIQYTLSTRLTARRLPPEKRAAYRARRQQTGSRELCRILGVKVRLVGEVPTGRGMLMVCNHIGLLDTITLASQLPLAFVGKAELRSWPIVGSLAREMGMLLVKRDRKTQASAFVEAVVARQRQGVHVLVFPEGTTGRGPQVMPFKTGAFAAMAGTSGEVLPMYLAPMRVNGEPITRENRHLVTWAGNTQSFVAHAWQLFGHESIEMDVRVGRPVAADGLDRKELARRAHQEVSALADAVAA